MLTSKYIFPERHHSMKLSAFWCVQICCWWVIFSTWRIFNLHEDVLPCEGILGDIQQVSSWLQKSTQGMASDPPSTVSRRDTSTSGAHRQLNPDGARAYHYGFIGRYHNRKTCCRNSSLSGRSLRLKWKIEAAVVCLLFLFVLSQSRDGSSLLGSG